MNHEQQIAELKEIHAAMCQYGVLDQYLGELLLDLADMGFQPGVYRKGRYWRAHINVGSNTYHDGMSPILAFKGVIKRQLQFMKRYPE